MKSKIWLCIDQPSLNMVSEMLKDGWVLDSSFNRGQPYVLASGLVYHLTKWSPEEMMANLEAMIENPVDVEILQNVIEVKLDDNPETVGQWIGKGWRIGKERYSGKVQLELVRKLSELRPELFRDVDVLEASSHMMGGA